MNFLWFRRPAMAALSAALLCTLPGCIFVVGGGSRSYESGYADGSSWPTKRIGIEMDRPGPALAAQTGVNPAQSTLITRVLPGSPAEKAGLKQFDVITGIDDSADGSIAILRQRVQAKEIGQTVHLRLVRGGQVVEQDVFVERAPWNDD